MIYTTESADETREVGYNLAKKLHTGGVKRAYIAMRGEMGVGKTAFVSGFASYFGIFGVKSPTYSVMNRYTSPEGVRIYHFDMYRIADEDDLYSIGYDDYAEAEGYSLVEWSEKVEYAIPRSALYVTIERTANNECGRKITVDYGTEAALYEDTRI